MSKALTFLCFLQDCFYLLAEAYLSVYIISDRHASHQRGQAVGHQQATLTMRVKCLSKSRTQPRWPHSGGLYVSV